MNINFLNNCGYVVIVNIESGESVEIQPYCSISITCAKADKLNILVKRNITSQVRKGKYTLMLETKYTFTNVTDGEIFKITREKVRVNLNVYYDRLFLTSEKSVYLSESYNVIDNEKIKKSFDKSQLIHFLFIEPLEYLTGLFIALLVLGIVLSYIFGWIFAIIYFLSAYIFLLVIQWFSDNIFTQILNKGFKTDDDKKEFYKCFENEFIMRYYSNPNRTPFMNEIEIN
jgi:hypothetical protein